MAILKLDGDATGAVRATSDVNAKAKELSNTFKEVSDSTEKAGQSHQQSFGAHALGELASYAAGMLAVHKGIELVTEAMREQAEEKKRAAENVTGGLSGAGAIANVSRSPEDFARNVAFARRMMDDVIFKRSEQDPAMRAAAGIQASGASDSDREFLLGIGKQKRVGGAGLGEFAQNITRFSEGYDGKAGSFEDIAKQFIRAGSDTLGVSSPEDIGRQAADIADAARENGISPSKALAAFTTFARITKSSRRAGQMTKDWMDGKVDLTKNQAAQFASEIQSIQGAPKAALPDLIRTDERLAAARGAEEAEGTREGQFEDLTARRESLYEKLYSRRRQAHTSELGTGFRGAIRAMSDRAEASGNRMLGLEDQAISQGIAKPKDYGLTPEDIAEMKQYLKDISDTNREMKDGSRQPPQPSGRQE